jgi:cellulose synthase/poly-beta-1,6-N-acetylglucosamine synthase-like glycosyltransferase
VAITGGLLVAATSAIWQRDPAALFWTTLGYFSYELGLNFLLVTAAWRGLRAQHHVPVAAATDETRLSVLIAAHNERSCIFETLTSVFAQQGVITQVIVASDGSTDGMNESLVARFALRPDDVPDQRGQPWRWQGGPDGRLVLLALPKLGKGRALNAGLAEAGEEIVATLDADTRLAPGALAALAAAFREPSVAAAGGFVYVRNAARGPWLVRYQYWEYVKNFMWRIGLAHLRVCLQVSGAFGAFRTETLRAIGGFSGTSLVEDYEIIYRLHEQMRRARQDYRVSVVPDAVAYTDSPDTVPSFLHQRTRWFAGFLQTLWEYRRMIGDPAMGLLGWLMLPIKCVDAILPLWGFTSLAILVGAALGGSAHWQRLALVLFGVRWIVDLGLSALMWSWHRRLFPERGRELPGVTLGLHMATEGLVFNWFRQIAVLNAYSWFVRRVQKWHQPRWSAAALAGAGDDHQTSQMPQSVSTPE